MPKFTIVPLDTGSLILEKSMFTYSMNFGVKIDAAVIMWYIGGAAEKIIVDTSFKAEAAELHPYAVVKRAPEQRVENALSKIRIKPEEVDMVILTHLHWDHCQNNAMFRNARFVLQQEELRYAVAPYPHQAVAYEAPTIGMRPYWLDTPKFELINGDKEISRGISVIYTPGHTAGHQSIAVETTAGTYVIAGDIVPLYENWEGQPPHLPHIPTPISTNLGQYWKSLNKIEEIADRVLPNHDRRVLMKDSYP